MEEEKVKKKKRKKKKKVKAPSPLQRIIGWVKRYGTSVPAQLAILITSIGTIFNFIQPDFDNFDDSVLEVHYLGAGILAPFWETDEIPCLDFTATYYIDKFPVKTVSGACYDWDRNQLEGRSKWADVALIIPPNLALEGGHTLRVRYEWKQWGIVIHESVIQGEFDVKVNKNNSSGSSDYVPGMDDSGREWIVKLSRTPTESR